jgi:hypothetical protein
MLTEASSPKNAKGADQLSETESDTEGQKQKGVCENDMDLKMSAGDKSDTTNAAKKAWPKNH